MKRVIGLTGGIGTGKSWLTRRLRMTAYEVWDADEANLALWQEENFLKELSQLFESENLVINLQQKLAFGQLKERKKVVGELIFERPNLRKKVESLVWPLLKARCQMWLQERMSQESKFLFVCAPLLIEAQWFDLIDELWLITASLEVRVKRLSRRPGLTQDGLRKRLDSQLSDDERALFADHILCNDWNNDLLWQQALKLLSE